MSRFIRTVAGKTLLFLVCILSVCILLGSIAGAMAMVSEGGFFYTRTEAEIREEFLVDRLWERGYETVAAAIAGHPEREDDGQVRYEIRDPDGEILYRSAGAEETAGWEYSFSYDVLKRADGETVLPYRSEPASGIQYRVFFSLKETDSEYSLMLRLIHLAYSLRYAVFGIGLAALLLTIASFIALMSASGHRPDTPDPVPGPLSRVPYDLILALCAVFVVALFAALSEARGLDNLPELFIGILCCVAAGCVMLGLCMCTASRLKQRALLKNTVIFRLLKLIWKVLGWLWSGIVRQHRFNVTVFRGIPVVWKTVLVLVGISFVEFCALQAFIHEPDVLVALFFLEKLFLIPAILYIAISLRKLQRGGKALAEGDLSHITDTSGMLWDLKRHGEDLNSIAGGMAIAVEARLKSERMKTELITNVSHDIKTPLTSIINYAGLIGNEPHENEKISEYAEVLVRQSERLKRLIEDLVEASKASTGNLDVHLMPCDASVFLSQAAGEYEDKLQRAGLTLVMKQPDKELRIQADGRRMWRVFDNLMNNICKYAQTGTRVYLSLEQVGECAVITFRNTSREALNMSEEELMERFTRGDSSRNTEGNGLGLAIAKSMAELQGGNLTLSIDGDLFKAILSFPLI